MLKLQYFGHLLQIADSLEKSLMLGKIEGRRRRGHQRMKWLDGITDARAMNLDKLREMVRDRRAWHATVHGVTKSRTWLGDWITMKKYQASGEDGFLDCKTLVLQKDSFRRFPFFFLFPIPDCSVGMRVLSWHRAGLGSPNSSCRLYSSNAPPSYRLCPFLLSWPAKAHSQERILLVTRGISSLISKKQFLLPQAEWFSLPICTCLRFVAKILL